MDWLKKNYDRALLGVLVLVLLACAGLIVAKVQGFPEQFSNRNSAKAPSHAIPPFSTDALVAMAEAVKAPRTWKVHEGSLFVSRPYVLVDNEPIDPLEGSKDLHPPIKNSWLIKYDLPYWEGDIKDQDADEDRFSNLEEFLADTDPTDAKSVPPFYTKLRLRKFIAVPFRLIFTGTPDDGQTFTVNTKDLKSRTQFLELGQSIQGAPYKLLSYEKKSVTENDIEKDVSELTIENTETGEKIVLVANREANDPTSFGEFVYLYDGAEIRVKKDDEFSLSPETDVKYKLIDISDNEAVIENLKTQEKIKVPRLEP